MVTIKEKTLNRLYENNKKIELLYDDFYGRTQSEFFDSDSEMQEFIDSQEYPDFAVYDVYKNGVSAEGKKREDLDIKIG